MPVWLGTIKAAAKSVAWDPVPGGSSGQSDPRFEVCERMLDIFFCVSSHSKTEKMV
jgi:hypothetical protein